MDNFTEDLLNLCRLNLMEENVINSESPDRDATLTAIDWKKRNLANRLIQDEPQNDVQAAAGGFTQVACEG